MKVFVLSLRKNWEQMQSIAKIVQGLGIEVADDYMVKEDEKRWNLNDHKAVQRSIMHSLGHVYISDILMLDMTEKDLDYKEYLSYLGAAYALYKTIMFVGPSGFEDKECKCFQTFPEYHYGAVTFTSDWNDAFNVLVVLKQALNE